MPTLRTADASLHYDEYGAGDEIVIACQQSFGPANFFESLAQPPTSYHAFTIVARGFAPSSRVLEDLGADWYPTWANDVAAFAQQLGIQRFVYAGVSHGAVIGWHLAADHPELLKALISIVGAPHDRAGGTLISEGRRAAAAAQGDPAAMRGNIERMLAPTSDPARLARREELVQGLLARPSAAADTHSWAARIGKGFPQLITNEELASYLTRISVPTLILGGLHDPLCKPEDNLRAARSVAGAKLVLWQDAGHLLASELPEAVQREIKLFVDELNQH